MKAAWFESFGPAEDVLALGEQPVPGAGEVLVRLSASGVNPSDVKKRAGSFQWASLGGARVIATASSAQDQASCREVGADALVNHREPDWASAVLAANGGNPVDRVVDVEFGANLEPVLNCIRIGGVIATYSSMQVAEPKLPFFRMPYMDLNIRIVIVYAMPEAAKRQAIEDITRALKEDRLVHRIAHEIPLDDIATSHRLIENGGFRGCVVVVLD